MKNRLSTILLILVFLIGLSLLLYPSFSDWWNSFHQSKAISDYAAAVAELDETQYDQYWAEAWQYNRSLLERSNSFLLSEEQKNQYTQLLDISDIGVMGYVEIPAIHVTLPIYHGTSEGVLQVAIGHLEWTSLPVGGSSSHCVISGHRGLPSARLFTDLDELVLGDIFMIRVLNEILTYQVDQILIVNPDEVDELLIHKDKDYCTLVTCTPYGINTHRILVRGHRIENIEEAAKIIVTADAMQIDPVVVAPMLAAPLLLLLLIGLLIPKKRRR